jgi:hypothetical protein
MMTVKISATCFFPETNDDFHSRLLTFNIYIFSSNFHNFFQVEGGAVEWNGEDYVAAGKNF